MRLLRTASFTLLALVAFVLLAEGAARLLDPLLGHALAREDPFVGQWGLTPVFVPDPADPNYLVTNPKKNGAFRAQRLPKRKLSGEFRILALGGSDTHGFP
ncbi:MAG: hypothetical protein K8I02_12190, partial [Candidatus Methylomirabilis sp.]|nr:hypothetical protein [Deltaproteobacteria bacterium]